MARAKTVFVCSECGSQSPRWTGQCTACGEWNTMIEQTPVAAAQPSKKAVATPAAAVAAQKLKDVSAEARERTRTGIRELDRVLGGGIVSGSAVLMGGAPGIGKSTLLLQMCDMLSTDLNKKVLYVSGEESAHQIKLRAQRLGCKGELYVLCENDVDAVLGQIYALSPDVAVIDSIQTMSRQEQSGSPGAVGQVREATACLTRCAKLTGCAVFIVGHVTKEGAIAGPKLLEHLVDTVLYFEGEGDVIRILRAAKNRFGSTNEIGVFRMESSGMAEVDNPSALFLTERDEPVAGCAVLCAFEGSRPVLAEVQALVSDSPFGVPRRMAAGVDYNRMVLLAAVLEKKLGYRLSNQDIYVNVAGGFKPEERACDLAVIAALASSFKNTPLPRNTVLIGEVGLTGEIRSVDAAARRAAECAVLGYENIVLPEACARQAKVQGANILGVKTCAQALAMLL